MAKATKTIRQALQYPPQSAHSFAEHQALYNRVVAFYSWWGDSLRRVAVG
ncbi:hypothetical protein [Ktedonobacter racemifer]|nr:hypothetical protein [Ktedonobacter racemifer]